MRKLFILLATVLLLSPAFAAKMPMPSDMPKSYEAECASCHMAYPPGLLSEKSWQNVMNGLSKHFGTDASIDQKDQTEIAGWLKKNSATRQKYSESTMKLRQMFGKGQVLRVRPIAELVIPMRLKASLARRMLRYLPNDR